jgi:hypothetical protein
MQEMPFVRQQKQKKKKALRPFLFGRQQSGGLADRKATAGSRSRASN